MQKQIIILTACSLLYACEETVEPKSFYIENDAARKAKLAWCADSPNVEYTGGNCLNAGVALHEKIERQKKARELIRQQRWDFKSLLNFEEVKCGSYKNTETYKSCRDRARAERDGIYKQVNEYNAETDALIDALK